MNRQKWSILITGMALAIWAALGSNSPALADEFVCQGSLGSITVDDLRVPEDAICVLSGTMVGGNIIVEKGAVLDASFVKVSGNIKAREASRVELSAGSSVEGNITIEKSGAAEIRSVEVAGNLQLKENRRFLNVDGNTVGENLQVNDNEGGVSITGNTVGGNLQCKENDPPPTGGDNLVSGAMEDQCESFGDAPPPRATGTPTPIIDPTTAPTTPPPSPTPKPPTATPRPTQDTPAALNAEDDRFTFTGEELRIAAPGLLGNDTFEGSDPVEVILSLPPRQGSLTLGRDGDFVYQVDYGPFGEDSFEYRLKNSSGESNPAVVRLVMDDAVAPQVEWVGPVPAGERIDVYDGQRITLEVTAYDNGAVESIEFLYWDAVDEQYRTLGILHQAPFRLSVDANVLNLGWNQVFVMASDLAGNSSEIPYIWMYKLPSQNNRTYLPLAWN